MNSWTRSACYPQGSFYPLSYGPYIRDRKITMSDFRPCSSCRTRSQAPLCHCTRGTISDRAELTFERLRYLFGGDRPSQTAHLTMSPDRIHGRRLEFQKPKGGIPTMTPRKLTLTLPSLPPILYIDYRNPISGYSKALRGLSVQSRVNTHLHVYYNFAGPPVETSSKSLRLSCGSELTRQGISLP